MKQILLFALLLLFNSGCRDKHTPDKSKSSTGLSYLALGDSYTIGESVPEAERWPVVLAKSLTAEGKVVQSPYIIARTGWTTGDLLAALQNYHPEEKYDMVSLLIGVNNQYQNLGMDEYRSEFRELLQKSIIYAGDEPDRVFVLSIPDWGVTPYGDGQREQIANEIDAFNQVAAEECDKLNIKFIDITPTSRLALGDPTMVAGDRLHFSGKMYRLWVAEVLKNL